MIPVLLGLLVCPVLASAADEAPSVELVRLEVALNRQQSAVRGGSVTPEANSEFVKTFRAALDNTVARIPASAVNSAAHARILIKLGDYASAERLARQAWEASGHTDKRAFTLLKLTEGRSSGSGSDPRTIPEPIEAADQPAPGIGAIIADAEKRPRVQTPSRMRTGGAINQLHAMGDEDAAPEATVMDWVKSLLASDAAVIEQDASLIHANAQDFMIPDNAMSLGTTNSGALSEFSRWLKTVKREEMPPLDYKIIDKGLFGVYEMGLLGKGSLSLSHHIRDAEPEARTAVLMHELYHYWDKKVARNHYENVSYGKIGEGFEAQHEYNAYLLTALYWKQFAPTGAKSALARSLGRLPTDSAEVQRAVDAMEAERNRK